MKTKEELIKSIHVVDSNFEHIAKTGKINGTLMLGIERILDEYAEEYAKAFGEFCFNTHVPGENDIDDVFKMFKKYLKK